MAKGSGTCERPSVISVMAESPDMQLTTAGQETLHALVCMVNDHRNPLSVEDFLENYTFSDLSLEQYTDWQWQSVISRFSYLRRKGWLVYDAETPLSQKWSIAPAAFEYFNFHAQ